MSSYVKKICVYALLAALTLWPLVHMRLVKTHGLSAWKLAGWGMYAEPRFNLVGMEIFFRRHGADALEQLTAPSAELQLSATRFLERRRWLGRLAPADELADRVFELHDDFAHVEIRIFRPAMQRDTGMVVMDRADYRFDR